MRLLTLRVAGFLLCISFAMPAHAHKPSDSYLSLSVPEPGAPATLSGRWDIALRDLDFALGLDANGDGQITWGEVRSRHADIAAYAVARLSVKLDGVSCAISVGAQQVDEHTDGAYSVLPLSMACPGLAASSVPSKLTLEYRLFADLDPQHRGLVNLSARGASRAAVLGPQAPLQTFDLGETSRWLQFADYAHEGVWHIWIGFDHILFLLSLLLPAVLVWQPAKPNASNAQTGWRPTPTFAPAFWDVLRIVTAFTVAHSVTLTLATLRVVELPSRLVESAIAASVVLAALNNIKPLFLGRRWMVAFGFGLIHGFGFASVLADLGLPQGALSLALLGFNLGVEGGQLTIVAVFLPLAFALRRTLLYRRFLMLGGSWLIVALASMWLAERLLNLKLLPF